MEGRGRGELPAPVGTADHPHLGDPVDRAAAGGGDRERRAARQRGTAVAADARPARRPLLPRRRQPTGTEPRRLQRDQREHRVRRAHQHRPGDDPRRRQSGQPADVDRGVPVADVDPRAARVPLQRVVRVRAAVNERRRAGRERRNARG